MTGRGFPMSAGRVTGFSHRGRSEKFHPTLSLPNQPKISPLCK